MKRILTLDTISVRDIADAPAAGQAIAPRQSGEVSRKPTSSRMSKRKAGVDAIEEIPVKKESDEGEEQREDQDGDFEADDPMRTPETTDEGSSEGENHFEAGPGPDVPSESSKSMPNRDKKKGFEVIEHGIDAPPPPRDIPTGKTDGDTAPQQSGSQTEDEETDDEL